MISRMVRQGRQILAAAGVVFSLMGSSCNESAMSLPPRDIHTMEMVLDTPAGSVGICIPAEIYPGYSTCIMDQPQHVSVSPSREQALHTGLPYAITLREMVDTYCPPVHDQGQCGWCVPHATTAAMEILSCISEEASERVSEPHLWYMGKGDVNDCRGGWYVEAALQTAVKNALVPAEIWPYSASEGRMEQTQPSDRTLEVEGRYSLEDFLELENSDLESIKAAIAQANPVIYSLPVFCDAGWFRRDSEGERDVHYGDMVIPEENGGSCGKPFSNCADTERKGCLVGYHAVVFVGYDDDSERFELRNSWGEDWADNGYGFVAYDYVQQVGSGGAVPTIRTPLPTTEVPPDEEECVGSTNICYEGDVHRQDGCGNIDLEEVVDDCTGLEDCIDAVCVPHLSGKIVFASDRDGTHQIYTMNGDGSSLRRITTNDAANFSCPRWSPDGSKIAYISDQDQSNIYQMNSDGSNPLRLTSFGSGLVGGTSWSPDGTQLAFLRAFSPGYETDGITIFTIGESDSVNPIFREGGSPEWSPDGTKLAFVMGVADSDDSSINLINIDGSGRRSLTESTSHNLEPSWSPDGRKIAFVSARTGGTVDLFVMNEDGSNQTSVMATTPTYERKPRWSPDGRNIIFSSYGDSASDIYVVTAEGTELTQLTYDPAADTDPDWTE